ncbi:MAG TPA: alpha/beta fold hydrolase [Ktedonobacteraceae bacterium]|jgi:thioesterase domain-containing protein
MPDTPELSETKRVLLEKYLQGELSPQAESLLLSSSKGTQAGGNASVLALHRQGSNRPFFFLHGQWDGQSFYCYPLAERLGADQPFYAIDPYDLPHQRTLPTLEAMARTHLQLIRTIQPQGPYLLGGWCNGAVVAYEMARQLQAAGEKLEALILMDASALTYTPLHRLYYRGIRLLGACLHLGVERQIRGYLNCKHVLRLARRFVRYRLIQRRADPAPLPFRALRQDYARLYDWVMLAYKPQSIYQGKIFFLWAAQAFQTRESRQSWRKIETQGENEAHLLPGNHITVRTEHLPVLADRLDECLKRVQTQSQ